MDTVVKTIIESCDWSPVKHLIFSENVFAPLIYYSHFGAMMVSLFFGFFILLHNRKDLLSKTLFFLTISINVWMFSDLVLWATNKPEYTMFFWSLEILFEPLIYVLSLFFIYIFIDKKHVSNKIKLLCYGLILPTIILLPTKLSLTGFDLTNCDRVAIEGILPKYGYMVQIFIILWIVVLSFSRYKEKKDTTERKQILLISTGICLFLFSFSLGNIAEVISGNWYIGQIGYIGIPIFISFLSYLIVKYRTFKIRVMSTQVLITATWFLIVSTFFVRTLENIRLIVGITLALFSILGIFLIRSVKREVEQREKIEKLAKDLASANEKLKELDQMKSEFLSLATHQIRAPLTAIKGYSSMLIEGDFGVIPDKAKKAVSTVYTSCQNLIDIVGDFLNISRIEQGRMVYDKSKFDIQTVVKEVVNELRPNIENAGLKIETKIQETIPLYVNADRIKIKQIFGDILDNSIKYTKEGSIFVSVYKQDNEVLIETKDTGVGIDRDEIPKLFNKFKRSKDANKTNVIGTGLGLYISKKMIEAQDGSITIFSEGLGKGSTFTIKLPLVT